MCEIALRRVVDVGGDVLRVAGQCADHPEPAELVAFGWMSATTNHYDTDKDGARLAKAKPRTMMDQEIAAYGLRLLTEQNPDHAASEPTVLFEATPA